jgi:Sortase domain
MAAARRLPDPPAPRPAAPDVSPAPTRPGQTRERLQAPARPGRARTALGALALVLVLGSCAVPAARPTGPGAPAAAPGPAPAAAAGDPAGGGVPGSPGEAAAERAGGPAGEAASEPSGEARAAGAAAPRHRVDVPARPPRAPGFEVAEAPRPLTVPGPASPPVRLTIPSIRVATPLVRLGRERDGSMQVPVEFARVGWFAEGPAPGQVGPAVLAGHVDSKTGPAVFYRLRELRPGDTVQVERADGARLRFVVEQARGFPKAAFPTAAVFGPAPWAALRLVTCGGDFDRARGSYRDNLVVFARLAGVSR